MQAIEPQAAEEAHLPPLWNSQSVLASAYINRATDTTRRQGDTMAGPMTGVRFAVKDNIHTKDLPTTAGTDYLRNHQPRRDAAVVRQLRNAGARISGKTNMHELGLGITSDNAAFGPVRNPFNPALSAGGSSGGSAVAVATGEVPFALGTDTGGSARIPAAFCGIYGFRPTTHRYSHNGLIRISWTRDTIGVLASSLNWICRVDQLLTGRTRPPAPDVQKVRLGVSTEFYEGLDPQVGRVTVSALDRLANDGVQLIELRPSSLRARSLDAGFPIINFETEHLLRRYLRRLERPLSLSEFASTVKSPDVRVILESLLQDPVSRDRYRFALELRSQLQASYQAILDDHAIDALLSPTTPRMPPRLGVTAGDTLPQPDLLREVVENATLATIVASPSVSLPAGTSSQGLPVGLMLDGRSGHDESLLAIAAAIASVLSPVNSAADTSPNGRDNNGKSINRCR